MKAGPCLSTCVRVCGRAHFGHNGFNLDAIKRTTITTNGTLGKERMDEGLLHRFYKPRFHFGAPHWIYRNWLLNIAWFRNLPPTQVTVLHTTIKFNSRNKLAQQKCASIANACQHRKRPLIATSFRFFLFLVFFFSRFFFLFFFILSFIGERFCPRML